MILVVVGTANFPFSRLLAWVAALAKEGIFNQEVLVQAGVTPFSSAKIKVFPFVPFAQMRRNFRQASLVITHAGSASTMLAITEGKKAPILVPRLKRFGEHVDDHQVGFAKHLAETGAALVASSQEELKKAVIQARESRQSLRRKKLPEPTRLVENLINYTEKPKK